MTNLQREKPKKKKRKLTKYERQVVGLGENMGAVAQNYIKSFEPTEQPTTTGAKTRDDLIAFCMCCQKNVYAGQKHGICEPLTEKGCDCVCHQYKDTRHGEKECPCQPTGKECWFHMCQDHYPDCVSPDEYMNRGKPLKQKECDCAGCHLEQGIELAKKIEKPQQTSRECGCNFHNPNIQYRHEECQGNCWGCHPEYFDNKKQWKEYNANVLKNYMPKQDSWEEKISDTDYLLRKYGDPNIGIANPKQDSWEEDFRERFVVPWDEIKGQTVYAINVNPEIVIDFIRKALSQQKARLREKAQHCVIDKDCPYRKWILDNILNELD